MALISCSDCGNPTSDLAAACPRCGRPIATAVAATPRVTSKRQPKPRHVCIHCGSANLAFGVDERGFDAGNAVLGAMLFGPLGALFGESNKHEVHVRCNDCLQVFMAKELLHVEEMAQVTAEDRRQGWAVLIGVFLVLALMTHFCSAK